MYRVDIRDGTEQQCEHVTIYRECPNGMSSVIEMLFPQWFDHYLTSRTRQQDRQNDVAMMHMECLLTKRVLKAYRHLKHASSSPSPHASFLNQSSQVRHGIDKKSIAKPQSSTCARNPSRICSAIPGHPSQSHPLVFPPRELLPMLGPKKQARPRDMAATVSRRNER